MQASKVKSAFKICSKYSITTLITPRCMCTCIVLGFCNVVRRGRLICLILEYDGSIWFFLCIARIFCHAKNEGLIHGNLPQLLDGIVGFEPVGPFNPIASPDLQVRREKPIFIPEKVKNRKDYDKRVCINIFRNFQTEMYYYLILIVYVQKIKCYRVYEYG